MLPRVSFAAPGFDWLVVIAVQRWRWIVAIALAAGLGVLVALPFLTPQYEISAALLYKLGREQSEHALTGGPQVNAVFKRTEDVTSEAEILTSQALVEDLVKAFGADYFLARPVPTTLWQRIKATARDAVRAVRNAITELMILAGLEKRLSDFEKVVSALQSSLQAEAVKRADVVDVKLLMADPRAGVDVMNKLIELYLAAHIHAFQTPGATRFLVDRADALKAELAALEAQRLAFSERSSLWDLPEQRRSLLQQQRELQQALARTLEDSGRIGAELKHIDKLLARGEPERRVSRIEEPNPVARALQLRIVEQRSELEKLRLVYGADSRRIEDQKAELTELEKLLSDQSRSVTQRETFELSAGFREAERARVEQRTRLAGLQAQEQRQREQLRGIDAELQRLEGLGATARRIDRDMALADQNYQVVNRRLEQSRIADALDVAEISNVALIGRPTASISPVRPRAKLLLAAALAAGLLGSFGFFVLRDALRPALHSRDKAEQLLGAPVLARVPELRP